MYDSENPENAPDYSRAVRPPLRHRARAGVLRGGARGAARDGREAQRGAGAAGGRGRHVPGGRARDGRRAPAAAAHGGRAHVRAAGVGAGGAVRRVSCVVVIYELQVLWHVFQPYCDISILYYYSKK